MSESHRMTDFGAVCAFIFAGKATFTIVSRKTGARFTYRVRRNESEFKGKTYVRHFVSVLVGADNETSYAYIGHFVPGTGFLFGKPDKVKVSSSAPSAKAFDWFAKGLLSDKGIATLDQVEFWHEGRCCRCGRTLTVPSSIETGVGPECSKFMAVAA